MARTGRPREFDEEQALEKAMLLFWKKGYRNTSLTNLTDAMGMNRPSMYSVFGDKSSLFQAALQRYISDYASKNAEQLSAHEHIADAIDGFLKASANVFTLESLPGGCMVACHLSDNELDEPILVMLDKLSATWSKALTARFREAKRVGQLGDSQSPKHLASLVVCVLSGLSHASRNGAKLKQLESTVDAFTLFLRQ